jgi:hypothetical protein
MGFFRRLLGLTDGGLPLGPSTSNGSSAFHLWWHDVEHESTARGQPIVAAAATLEVLQRPTTDDLYFWAMQATFTDGSGRSYGGAHLGLQWNRNHPGSTAVNWGGYADVADFDSILGGSESPLPSAPNDPNTRDYPWQEGGAYRLRISRADDGWRGEVHDLRSGEGPVVVRRLHLPGDRLRGLVVWAEVFAPCRAPTTVVRWSSLVAELADGSHVRPRSVGLSFPAEGCPNNDTLADEVGYLQVTATDRRARDGDSVANPEVAV